MVYIYSCRFREPVGDLAIAEMDGNIVRVLFDWPESKLTQADTKGVFDNEKRFLGLEVVPKKTGLIDGACAQLNEFLDGKRAVFDLPLDYQSKSRDASGGGLAKAPTFSERILKGLLNVPAGRTVSYAELAAAAGNSRASRAAGTACGNNPIPIFVPCHRAIGSDGGLHGFAGGLPMKKYLLALEKEFYG